MATYRIAHLSDPHLLDLTGVPTSQLVLNKRITGFANLKLKRGSHHKPRVVEAMMDDLAARRVDHVVITGDLTNLALDPEFARARAVIERMGYSPDDVSVVPGNHDLYTGGAARGQRFVKHFAKYITSDLDVAAAHPSGPFPYVRLRGPAAIIGLSTAVPRLPLVASGWAGDAQLAALERILARDELAGRVPVVLMHHPVTNPTSALATVMRGWREAPTMRRVLSKARESLALHGHLHHRVHEVIAAEGGSTIHRLGATSASLVHHNPHAMAGYNLYEVSRERGLERVSARVWNASSEAFDEAALPQHA